MGREHKYFVLELESLRVLGGWTAACAERALPVFEKVAALDPRPRAAIAGIRAFAAGGRRTAQLRVLALQAHAAAREVGEPAAAAAANAAGSAAASAYTHPLVDVHQTKHVVGAAAYAALALALDRQASAGAGGDPAISDRAVQWAIQQAPGAVRDILLQMPARQMGKSRLDGLLYALDAGLRGDKVLQTKSEARSRS